MKRGNFFANCVFAVSVILTVLSFSACTDDSNDVVATTSEVIEQAEVPFSVVLKAMNSDGNDITTKGEVNGAGVRNCAAGRGGIEDLAGGAGAAAEAWASVETERWRSLAEPWRAEVKFLLS